MLRTALIIWAWQAAAVAISLLIRVFVR